MNRIFNLQRIGSQYHIANNPAISATEHNLKAIIPRKRTVDDLHLP